MSSYTAFPVGWRNIEIKDASISIIDGDRGKHYPSKDEFSPDGFCLFLNTGNIKADTFDFSNCDFITENRDGLLKKGKLRRNDIVLTTRGTVGSTAYYHPNIPYKNVRINSGMVIFRSEGEISARFLCQLLKSSLLKSQYELFSSGSAQPQLPIKDLRRIKLPLPPPATQIKIAAILTAYDDLIETNKRRIALLEKMAEELYREWFVRMRFPGYQNTKFVKGVPEGWPLQRFTELVSMNPRESVHKSDFVPYVGMDALSTSSMYFETDEVRQGAAGSKFRNRDTLLPRITPCLENGKRGFVNCLQDDQVGIGSTEFIVFREKVLPAEYIYLLSCNASFRQHAELSMTGASGRQRVQHDCFSYFYVPTPPQVIRNEFSAMIKPMFETVALLAKENVNLTQTRDLLLPRLISGKLAVEDLDIQLPPSMREEAG